MLPDPSKSTCADSALQVESFYHIVAEPGGKPWGFSLHSHDEMLEISLIVSGKAELECERVKYTLIPGDVVIKNAGVLHSEFSSPAEGLELYCLGISGVRVNGLPPDALIPDGVCPVISSGAAFDYLRSMTAYLYDNFSDPSIASSGITIQAIENGLSIVNMIMMDAVERSKTASHSQLISDVLDHIDTHVEEAMSLDTISKRFYVSSYHLAHKFKDEIGCTVNQYILNRKLGAAQERLVFGSEPIKEIASNCGYSSLQYFYSVFKKNTGSTPAEMRHYYDRILAKSV